MRYTPDFLLIPYILIQDNELNAVDTRIYSVIYYLSQLKDKKCTASNRNIAEIACLKSVGTVRNSLSILEKKGYIKRIFKDTKKKKRQEIIPLITFNKASFSDEGCHPQMTQVSSTDDTRVSSTDAQSNNSISIKRSISLCEQARKKDSEWITSGGELRNQRGKKQKRDKEGKFTPLKSAQVLNTDTAIQVPNTVSPSPSYGNIQVLNTDTKETHREGNTYKETHICEQAREKNEVNEILNLFYETINPAINFTNKAQRQAVEWLITHYGFDKTAQTVKYAISVQGKDYAPTITTPYQLKDKLAALLVYYKKNDITSKFGVHITE
jgi:hypothetical protein